MYVYKYPTCFFFFFVFISLYFVVCCCCYFGAFTCINIYWKCNAIEQFPIEFGYDVCWLNRSYRKIASKVFAELLTLTLSSRSVAPLTLCLSQILVNGRCHLNSPPIPFFIPPLRHPLRLLVVLKFSVFSIDFSSLHSLCSLLIACICSFGQLHWCADLLVCISVCICVYVCVYVCFCVRIALFWHFI